MPLEVKLTNTEEILIQYAKACNRGAEYTSLRFLKATLYQLVQVSNEGNWHDFHRRPSKWNDFDGNLASGTIDACRLVASLLRKRDNRTLANTQGITRSQGRNSMAKLSSSGEWDNPATRKARSRGSAILIGRVSVENGLTKSGKKRYKKQKFFGDNQTRYYTRAYAKAWAAAHTRFRKHHRGFINVLPRDLEKAVIARMKELGMKGGGAAKSPVPSAMKAKASGFNLRFANARDIVKIAAGIWYTYQSSKTDALQPSSESAKSLEATLYAMLPLAQERALMDMQRYYLKKQGLWDDKWDEYIPSSILKNKPYPS